MRWKQASQGNCKELRGWRREGRRKNEVGRAEQSRGMGATASRRAAATHTALHCTTSLIIYFYYFVQRLVPSRTRGTRPGPQRNATGSFCWTGLPRLIEGRNIVGPTQPSPAEALTRTIQAVCPPHRPYNKTAAAAALLNVHPPIQTSIKR